MKTLSLVRAVLLKDIVQILQSLSKKLQLASMLTGQRRSSELRDSLRNANKM